MVLYRTLLTFLKWRQLQRTLRVVIHAEATPRSPGDAKRTNFSHSSMTSTTKRTVSVYRNKISCLFLVFIVFGTVLIAFSEVLHPYKHINDYVWLLGMVLAIVIVITTYKAKEGIGVISESRIIVFNLVCTFFLQHYERSHPVMEHVVHYFQLFSLLVWGLLPIYLTLYNIYRCEGTLNYAVWTQGQREHAVPAITPDIDRTKPEQPLNLKQPLCVFLEDQTNYKAFAQYLVYCFAIENLLFLERVCIFNEILNELKTECIKQEMDSSASPERPQVNETVSNAVMIEMHDRTVKTLRIRFVFLNQIYEKFRRVIETEYVKIINTEGESGNAHAVERSFTLCKPGLDRVVGRMVNEFIVENSPHQVNIVYEQRDAILEAVEHMERLVTFDDYQQLFQAALMEVYQLNVSLYQYTFKSYIRKEM
eukprot:CAMPEP_0197036572 /NCGR_PEP_ID=MMETSP1384-20130603/14041_1 /TAXON_ID=29189 /ORGANISM="Ammonia sp." /LENGTH=421 /DNA_ID=CAMNT_0042466765 /DNA_START=360 /DNA_END=1625 /DNA_ORIENTATION=-